LDAATLLALETTDVNVLNFPATQTVDGTVALDAAFLSALENITIDSIIADVNLSATTLAALETIELGATSLAALENITIDAGSIELGATSLAALENITIDGGTVAVSNFPALQPVSGTVNVGNFPVVQPISGSVSVISLPAVELAATTLSALENITVDGGTISVDNFPLTQTVTGNISVSNFPATQTVAGTVALDVATLAALENITVTVDNFPVTQTVAGTVELGATTLAALEETTVSLDAASLAALENITVDNIITGEVALDTATLAALENTTVTVDNFPTTQTVTGTVTLDAPTLAALENITVDAITAPVALDAVTLAALETVDLGATTLAALENVTIDALPAVALDAATLAALETITVDSITNPVAITDNGGSITVDGTVALDAPSLAALETVELGSTTIATLNDHAAGGPTHRDAFGRLRVSNPTALFDSKQLHSNLPLFYDDQEVSGTATTSTWSQARASSTISVGASAGRRVRQTFMRFNYQPGKSQLILATGVLIASGGGSGIKSSFGYYDDNNGVFVQNINDEIGFVVRSSVTGAVVDDRVTQANWNGDKLDGTGPSGIIFDATQAQIFWTDLEWLGVGTVRVGFVINGQFILCHSFHHANTINSIYMSTPNLPIRYEIENDGTGSPTSLEHICSTVMSEGGSQATGQLHSIVTSNSRVATTTGVTTALIGIRLKTTAQDTHIDLKQLSVLNDTRNPFEWSVWINPTVAGAVTWNSHADSNIESFFGATTNTITGGHEIAIGLMSPFSNQGGAVSTELSNAIRLGASIAGVSDIIVLAMKSYVSPGVADASLSWREL